MTLPLAIWTTGRPVPAAEQARGNFFSMIEKGLRAGFSGELLDIDSENSSDYPDPRSVCGIVVSGSPARLITQDPWMLRAMEALRRAHQEQTPILGICFGHQLLGQALGGRVTANPLGREIGTVPLTPKAEDPLLDGITAPPVVVMTHLDSVVEIASTTTIIASTDLDRYAGLRFSGTTWGVQYHPEMDDEIVGYYIRERIDQIRSEGLDPERLLESRTPSDHGRQLLSRFGYFCAHGQFPPPT